jgi:hypothetical protein
MDWDSYGPRIQNIHLLDPNGNVLDTRQVSNFTGGQYLIWNIIAHVEIRSTNLNSISNSVIEGLFFF